MKEKVLQAQNLYIYRFLTCFLFVLGITFNSYAINVFDYPEFESNNGEFLVGSGINPEEKKGLGVPIGTVALWTKPTIPESWIECDGQAVNSTKYPDLYKIMSHVPDYRGRYAQGAISDEEVGTSKEAGLPNITGNLNHYFGGGQFAGPTTANGVFETSKVRNYGKGGDNDQGIYNITLNAARCSAVYGRSDTVQPPAVVVKYIIKAE